VPIVSEKAGPAWLAAGCGKGQLVGVYVAN
jgi:hypothetical protein